MKTLFRLIAMMIFLSLAPALCASAETPVSVPAPEPTTTPAAASDERAIKGLLLAGIGGGGYFSSGAQTGALLFSAAAGFRFRHSFELGLSYRLRAGFPENDARSLVHGCLVEGRGFLWRGLYLGAGLGLAVLDLRLSPYREFTPGAAWLLAVGYRHDISAHVGFFGELFTAQHYTKGLYTALGAQAGIGVYF